MDHGDIFDFVIPRDEHEVVELFDALIFFRGHYRRYMIEHGVDVSEMPRELGYPAQRLLRDTNSINRLFRAWYQTTWGDRTWHEDFDGETPRQELGIARPEIRAGTAMLSVDFERNENGRGLDIVPRYYDAATLKKHGGPFSFGVAELAAHPDAVVVEPNFDPDFRAFVTALQPAYHAQGKSTLPGDTGYLAAWWPTRGAAILAPLLPEGIDDENRTLIENLMQNVLDIVVYDQVHATEQYYVLYDQLFAMMWDLLLALYPDLPSARQVQEAPEFGVEDDPRSVRGLEAFLTLNHMFETEVLFPLDRYFNGAEVVWQMKDTFVDSLAMLQERLRNNMREPISDAPDTLAEAMLRESGFSSKFIDPMQMWFNPMTGFRTHGAVAEYFRTTYSDTFLKNQTALSKQIMGTTSKKKVAAVRSPRRKAAPASTRTKRASKKASTSGEKQAYVFKITLRDVKPPIWRRIVVPEDATMWQLYAAILSAFEWMGYHLFAFRVPGERGGLEVGAPHPDDSPFGPETLPAWKEKMREWIGPNASKKLVLTYDFGDNWEHDIVFEKVVPCNKGEKYPQCLAGKRAAPIEDCGGAWGYMEMCKVLENPKHPNFNEYLEICTGAEALEEGEKVSDFFDPDHFDPEDIVFDEETLLLDSLKKGDML